MRSSSTAFTIIETVAVCALALEAALVLDGCSPKSESAPKAEALCRHEVAERFCPVCHPEVRNDPNILLCKEHGSIPEDICTACHPELKKKYKACAEHDLPPALCEACLAKSGKDSGSPR